MADDTLSHWGGEDEGGVQKHFDLLKETAGPWRPGSSKGGFSLQHGSNAKIAGGFPEEGDPLPPQAQAAGHEDVELDPHSLLPLSPTSVTPLVLFAVLELFHNNPPQILLKVRVGRHEWGALSEARSPALPTRGQLHARLCQLQAPPPTGQGGTPEETPRGLYTTAHGSFVHQAEMGNPHARQGVNR